MKMSVLNEIRWVVVIIAVLCIPISTYADLIYTFDVDTEGWVDISDYPVVSANWQDGYLVQHFNHEYPPGGEPWPYPRFDPHFGVEPVGLSGIDYRYFVASIDVISPPVPEFHGAVYFLDFGEGFFHFENYAFQMTEGKNIIKIDLQNTDPNYGLGTVLDGSIRQMRLDLPQDGSNFENWKNTKFRVDYVGLTNNPRYPDPIPEPATLTLLGLGMAGMAYRRLRK